MLKEEAHHMFVGATGVGRVVQRTAELMKQHDTDDIRPFGGVDVATLQRYLNFHFSVSLDLFGAETSTNAANYFASGLKGRFQEERRDDDHHSMTRSARCPRIDDGAVGEREVPALSALNNTLQDDYIADCAKGVQRWNRTLSEVGVELRLPHRGFNRSVGAFRDVHASPDGRLVSDEEWTASGRLAADAGRRGLRALIDAAVIEPGKMAGWVAPPSVGINGKPVEFEYVRVA